jgi:endonuclease/exonuclease/phosphatase family metal-dependent hydrolase
MKPLRILSFNIRYDNPSDGAHRWSFRRDAVIKTLRDADPDLIGLQEVRKSQLDELADRLPGYRWLGVGRDDGREAGEFAPIFYRASRFELKENGTFWLSETPDLPGEPAWGAGLRRIVTWGRFVDRQNGRDWRLFNAHLDHESQEARLKGSRLLLKRARPAAARQAIVVAGDFNCTPEMPAYALLTAPQSGLYDARERSVYPPEGPPLSFHPFFDGRAIARIDYVLVNRWVQVLRHRTLAEPSAGRFPSDHFPVAVDLELAAD